MAEQKIVLVGVNHKETPVEIRERLAFTQSKIEDSIERLVGFEEIAEHIILSTCNRVEIYARVRNHEEGINFIKKFIVNIIF